MAVAYRSDCGSTTQDGVASGNYTCTFVSTQPVAGDLVVAGGAFWAAAAQTITVSDNQSNTYTTGLVRGTTGETAYPFSSSNGGTAVHYKVNAAASGTFTVTFNTSVGGSYLAYSAVCFSGVATSGALDVSAANNVVNSATTTVVTGTTAAIAQTDSVAIIANGVSTGGSLTSMTATGFTLPLAVFDGGVHMVGGLGYKTPLSAGTQTATFTFGSTTASADDLAAMILVFKGAAAGTPFLPMQGFIGMSA